MKAAAQSNKKMIGMTRLKTCILLAGLLFFSEEVSAQNCCLSSVQPDSLTSKNIKAAGIEFQRLRRDSCQTCHNWNSELYRLMLALGKALDNKRKSSIIDVMGQPDQAGDSIIYEWRGGHDYLFFTRKSLGRWKSSWYYAYE